MLPHVRLHRIQALLSTHRQISTERLIRELGVSRETIRRDIITLEEQKLVKRVHGGIVAIQVTPEEAPLTQRQTVRTKEKKAIAYCLTQILLSPGQTLFIDAGSTTTHLAEALRTMSGLTIITNSIQAAFTLNALEGQETLKNKIILLGGDLYADAKETRGEETLNTIYRYHADMAILSPVGISAQGASSFYQWESAIAQAMIRQSNQCILLADHTKLGVQSRFYYAQPHEVDTIITDAAATQLSPFEQLNQHYPQIIIAH